MNKLNFTWLAYVFLHWVIIASVVILVYRLFSHVLQKVYMPGQGRFLGLTFGIWTFRASALLFPWAKCAKRELPLHGTFAEQKVQELLLCGSFFAPVEVFAPREWLFQEFSLPGTFAPMELSIPYFNKFGESFTAISPLAYFGKRSMASDYIVAAVYLSRNYAYRLH